MGEKDMTAKVLEDCKDVFADIINVLLLRKPIISADAIEDGPTESIYKSEDNSNREQRRDVLKRYRGSDVVIASLGIENQSELNKYMPVRTMGYDYASYRSQIDKGEKLHPVITLVLNFSRKDWNVSKELLDMMEIPRELEHLVFNYGCHVVDIHQIDDEVISQFKSDFRAVANFFKYGESYIEKIGDEGKLDHPEEVIDLISVFNGKNLNDTKEKISEKLKKGQVVSMCTIVQDIEAKGETKGEIKGEIKTYLKFIDDELITLEQAAEKMDISIDEFKRMAKEFGLL